MGLLLVRGSRAAKNGAEHKSNVALGLNPNVLDDRGNRWVRNQVIDTDFPNLDNLVGVSRVLVSELEKENVKDELDNSRSSKGKDEEKKSEKDDEFNVSSSIHELSAVRSNKALNSKVKGRLLWVAKDGKKVRTEKVENVREREDKERGECADKWSGEKP